MFKVRPNENNKETENNKENKYNQLCKVFKEAVECNECMFMIFP